MKLLKTLTAIGIIAVIAYSIYGIGVVTANDYNQLGSKNISEMDCFNYEINFNKLMVLQHKLDRSKSALHKRSIKRQMDKIYPNYMNQQSLCLGYTVEAN